jgi:hypothetical protein
VGARHDPPLRRIRARDYCPPFPPCSGSLISPAGNFSETVLDPGKIRGRSRRDRDGDELGHVVGVEAFHNRPQLHHTFSRSLDEQQSFARRFYLSFPPINGFEGARKYVHTSGEPGIHRSARNASRFGGSRTRHQNYKFVGQDFLQPRYSFSIPAHPIWLPPACHATIHRWRRDHYYFKPSHGLVLWVALPPRHQRLCKCWALAPETYITRLLGICMQQIVEK